MSAEDRGVRVYAIGNRRPNAIRVDDPDVRVLIILLWSLQRDITALHRVRVKGRGGTPHTTTTYLCSLPEGFYALLKSGTLASKSATEGAIN